MPGCEPAGLKAAVNLGDCARPGTGKPSAMRFQEKDCRFFGSYGIVNARCLPGSAEGRMASGRLASFRPQAIPAAS